MKTQRIIYIAATLLTAIAVTMGWLDLEVLTAVIPLVLLLVYGGEKQIETENKLQAEKHKNELLESANKQLHNALERGKMK